MPDDDKKPDEKPDENIPGGEAGEKPETPAEGAGPGGARKIVDEDWKAQARREKEELEAKIAEDLKNDLKNGLKKKAEPRPMPPADFLHLISGMAAQVLMQLGELENPIAGERRVDLDSARYSIDVMQMLAEKTKGNLAQEEERYLEAALHDLRMRFVGAATGTGKGKGDGSAKPTGPGPEPKPD